MNGCEHTHDAPIVAHRFCSRDHRRVEHEDALAVIDISWLDLQRRHERDLSHLDKIFLRHRGDLLEKFDDDEKCCPQESVT